MKKILPVIVISQFLCTSLWFAGNAIMGDISKQYQLDHSFLAYLTSTVQLGFIAGTLVFSILSISDRFSPSLVFLVCATIAAIVNLGITINGIGLSALLSLRFLTGFFLAGIYPVGMKIASDHEERGLGKSLGFLVGALVIGTAFPHLLKSFTAFPWRYVIFTTSLLSVAGGLAILVFVPDGPFRKTSQHFSFSSFLSCFRSKKFRAVAFGYFGHNWELYAFWVFVPAMLMNYQTHHPMANLNIPLLSFFIIGIGGLACVISGLVSQQIGAKKVATFTLGLSCLCCLLSPLVLANNSATVLIVFLLIWGMAVVADSPLFSTLVAQNAVAEAKGTALTIVICIGFALTIVSIQLISALRTPNNEHFIYLLLAIGPIFGLISLARDKA